jgi:hypothetical protein
MSTLAMKKCCKRARKPIGKNKEAKQDAAITMAVAIGSVGRPMAGGNRVSDVKVRKR